MAYSIASESNGVFGNKRFHAFKVTTDAASGAVDTGLSVIDFFSLSAVSAATGAPTVLLNANSGGTAVNGSFALSSTTSGDDFFVTVYGR